MMTAYLLCFLVGLVLSLLASFAGLGRVHLGHFHLHGSHSHVKMGSGQGPAFNGFTFAAFLCWFGGSGYLLDRFSPLLNALVLLCAVFIGSLGSLILYALIFKVLLPRERVLSSEDTRMEGMLARVSDEVRAIDGIGEILFSQSGTRRSAPARSEDGSCIPRDTEVVVLRYERGIAYVSPLRESSLDSSVNHP